MWLKEEYFLQKLEEGGEIGEKRKKNQTNNGIVWGRI